MAAPAWLSEGIGHIWLPYTQMKDAPLPLPVSHARGSRLFLADGRELIDGIASWWSVCHGYSHPHLVEAMSSQIASLSHVMFAGLAHEPAYLLAKRLVEFVGLGMNRVFFSDSGSTAVEVALKMAVQYYKNQGIRNKTKFLSFRHGYHGDTMGCMSLADPDQGMHKAFSGYLPMQYVVDIPSDEYSFAEFDALLGAIHHHTAAMVIEPLVQGAGGMKFHSTDVLAEIIRLARKHGLLIIADEIMTGFYRTGSRFACHEAGIEPDIICLGKALTGGMVGLAATLSSEKLFEGFLGDSIDQALMHGPTFMANPLACAAANASLDLFDGGTRFTEVDRIEKMLQEGLHHLKALEGVTDIRSKGAIGVVEFGDLPRSTILAMRQCFVDQGVWLRPFDRICYLMPSYSISDTEIEHLISAMDAVLPRFLG